MMIFKDKERGKGLGANTTTVGLAAITGPIFGGLLVGSFGWESIFITQAFLSIPAFILGYIFLKELITTKVLVSLIAVCIGIYFVKKGGNKQTI